MTITAQQIAEQLETIDKINPLPLGNDYFLFSTYMTIFPTNPTFDKISGAVILELHRKDKSTNPIENIARAIGIHRVDKKFHYNSNQELQEILNDLNMGSYPNHCDSYP